MLVRHRGRLGVVSPVQYDVVAERDSAPELAIIVRDAVVLAFLGVQDGHYDEARNILRKLVYP